MAKALIDDWIANGCNYSSGVLLLEKLSTDAFIIKLVKSGNSVFTTQKLKDALLALAAGNSNIGGGSSLHTHQSKSANAAGFNFSVNANNNGRAKSSSTPALIVELEQKAKALYKEANFKRQQLLHIQSQAERCQVALDILNLMDTVYECYDVTDRYKATGELPPAPAPVKLSLREIIQREATLQTYITKHKKMVLTTKDAGLLNKYSKKLTEFEQELLAVRKQIDQLDKKLADVV